MPKETNQHHEPTLGDAIVRARMGTMVVSAALEYLSTAPDFVVQTSSSDCVPFAPERLANSLRQACQSVGITDEAVAAEAAYLAVTLINERWPIAESNQVEKIITAAELRCAAYDALMQQGYTSAARAYICGDINPSSQLTRRGPGLTLKPLPLAATGIGDAKSLERAVAFAEKITTIGTTANIFADPASKSAFADAVAKLDAAAAWSWTGETTANVSFAPLSALPSINSVVFGGQPIYKIPTCNLNFSAFTNTDGLRIEILLAAIEVALVAADVLVEDTAKSYVDSATALRHVQVNLDFSQVQSQDVPIKAIRLLSEGQLIAASARLARALGTFRTWSINEKLALRQIGRLRDQAYKIAESTHTELADRLRLVWDEALELAMSHGLRNAGLFSVAAADPEATKPDSVISPSPSISPEPELSAIHHQFNINSVPAELWVSLKKNQPISLSIRCGAPGSATTIILDTTCRALSAALAAGLPVDQAVSPLLGSSFPPRGNTNDPAISTTTSPLDYACHWLIKKFPKK